MDVKELEFALEDIERLREENPPHLMRTGDWRQGAVNQALRELWPTVRKRAAEIAAEHIRQSWSETYTRLQAIKDRVNGA